MAARGFSGWAVWWLRRLLQDLYLGVLDDCHWLCLELRAQSGPWRGGGLAQCRSPGPDAVRDLFSGLPHFDADERAGKMRIFVSGVIRFSAP